MLKEYTECLRLYIYIYITYDIYISHTLTIHLNRMSFKVSILKGYIYIYCYCISKRFWNSSVEAVFITCWSLLGISIYLWITKCFHKHLISGMSGL